MNSQRYLLNISFKNSPYDKDRVLAIVETFSTKKEALSYKDLIDETVARAVIRDNFTDKITWLKNK